jgi:hypothetical protein
MGGPINLGRGPMASRANTHTLTMPLTRPVALSIGANDAPMAQPTIDDPPAPTPSSAPSALSPVPMSSTGAGTHAWPASGAAARRPSLCAGSLEFVAPSDENSGVVRVPCGASLTPIHADSDEDDDVLPTPTALPQASEETLRRMALFSLSGEPAPGTSRPFCRLCARSFNTVFRRKVRAAPSGCSAPVWALT